MICADSRVYVILRFRRRPLIIYNFGKNFKICRRVNIYMCVCVYIYTYRVYIYIYTHIYIYIYEDVSYYIKQRVKCVHVRFCIIYMDICLECFLLYSMLYRLYHCLVFTMSCSFYLKLSYFSLRRNTATDSVRISRFIHNSTTKFIPFFFFCNVYYST